MSANKLCFKYWADQSGKKNEDHITDNKVTRDVSQTYRPRIDVVFRKSSSPPDPVANPEFRSRALVDSGADICFIPKAAADILRLEVDEDSKKITTGAGGVFATYRANMHLEILYEEK